MSEEQVNTQAAATEQAPVCLPTSSVQATPAPSLPAQPHTTPLCLAASARDVTCHTVAALTVAHAQLLHG